jgi:hypothetical protein
VVGSLLISAGAEAQSVRLNRYDAPERADDGFAVRRITDLGKRRIGLVSVLDWAKHPLSVSVVSVDGSTTQRLIARDQLSMASALTLTGWNRALFFAKLDATLHMAGEDPGFTPLAPADRAGLGNTTIGGRVRLNAPSARVGVGLDAAIALPTGGLTQTYRGEDRVNGRVGMIADGRWSRLRATLNAGAAIREQIGLASSALGSELLVAGALAVRAARRLELELDVTGASALDHGLGHFGSRVEWLLGARTGGGPFPWARPSAPAWRSARPSACRACAGSCSAACCSIRPRRAHASHGSAARPRHRMATPTAWPTGKTRARAKRRIRTAWTTATAAPIATMIATA